METARDEIASYRGSQLEGEKVGGASDGGRKEDDEDDDPLDAFMAGIEVRWSLYRLSWYCTVCLYTD